ncbi:MAG: SDR family oxidoreductase [Verrucomicrobiota bacterium]|nr:SDR family oxidoreductase [Verrucomicrobiota bacterium]
MGKAIALKLAREGAQVVIDDVSHPEATDALQKEISALGQRAIGVRAEVSRLTELRELYAAAVREFGRVDIIPTTLESAHSRTGPAAREPPP